jgi:lipopolysaccharide/colanic/teichoic acid biosynthesis glycosyltransferase
MGSIFPEGIPAGKRIFDLIISLLGLIILSPFLLILCILVRIKLGKPVFFQQIRPGYKGKVFKIYKFRSMQDAYDEGGNLLPDEQRLTGFGRFLRSSSLDEWPELFNVLRGDMSLVGPRPLLVAYLERYSPEQMRRHDVLPGITGWAQVNGRNAISWSERFRLDVWYVDHWTFWLDIKILFLTLWKAFRREGINEPGYATVSEFMGNDDNGVAKSG